MLKITHVRLLACTALLAMVCSVSAQDAAPKLKSLAIGGVKVGKTLAKAVAASGKADSLNRVAEAMDGQLMDRLHNTRKFQLVARSDLDRVIEEQGLGKAGELTSARYLMVLSIDDFQDQQTNIPVRSGLTRQERTVRIGTLAKIYDAQTLEVLETANIPVIIPLTSGKFDNAQQDGDLSDIALSQIARESAFQIANRVIDVLYPAKVVSRNAQEVIINRGDGTYIAVGQEWVVRGLDTVEDDPDTGVKIKFPGPELGKVRVKDVRPLISIADVIEERIPGAIIKGASMKVIAAAPVAEVPAGSPGQPTQGIAAVATPAPAPAPVAAANPGPIAQGPISIAILPIKVIDSVLEASRKDGRQDSLNRVMEGIEPLLRQRLHDSGRFKLVAQSDMPDIDAFIDSTNKGDRRQAARLFNKTTPQFIVVVKFNDFQDQTVDQQRPSLGTVLHTRNIRMAAVATIYNGETGDMLDAIDVPVANGISSNTRVGGAVSGQGGSGTDAMLVETAVKAATDIAAKLMSRLSPITILDRTGMQVTINVGGALMERGQFWRVHGITRSILDPATGRTISIPGPAGVVYIDRSLPQAAIGQIREESTANPITAGWILSEPIESSELQQPAPGAR